MNRYYNDCGCNGTISDIGTTCNINRSCNNGCSCLTPQQTPVCIDKAYGGIYNTTASTISLTNVSQTTVPLTTATPVLNVTTGLNTLTVTASGVYEVDYFVSGSSTDDNTVTLSVLNNGMVIAGTSISQDVNAGVDTIISGKFIANLPAGSVISLGLLSSSETSSFDLNTNTSAYLDIIKIG